MEFGDLKFRQKQQKSKPHESEIYFEQLFEFCH